MKINPFIVGSGNAGLAMAKCLAMLPLLETGLEISPPHWIKRDDALNDILKRGQNPLLLIANPHGLHARYLLEGAKAGFPHMVTDKPACVSLEEVHKLRSLKTSVTVCHGYRMMWGPQFLKRIIDSGECGEIFAIEGRYWQSSTAQKALHPGTAKPSWKNDTRLGGHYDTLVDLGAHWVDLVHYLIDEKSSRAEAWLSYANAEAPHRDSHVQLINEFSGRRRALASISKTAHGYGNLLEIHVMGTKQAVSWSFEDPDRIVMGRGNERRTVPRTENHLGSRQPAFHAMGWVEGYLEILKQVVLQMNGKPASPVPTLSEHLDVMETLLSATLRKSTD